MVESGLLKTYSFILKEPGEKRQVVFEIYLHYQVREGWKKIIKTC